LCPRRLRIGDVLATFEAGPLSRFTAAATTAPWGVHPERVGGGDQRALGNLGGLGGGFDQGPLLPQQPARPLLARRGSLGVVAALLADCTWGGASERND